MNHIKEVGVESRCGAVAVGIGLSVSVPFV